MIYSNIQCYLARKMRQSPHKEKKKINFQKSIPFTEFEVGAIIEMLGVKNSIGCNKIFKRSLRFIYWLIKKKRFGSKRVKKKV